MPAPATLRVATLNCRNTSDRWCDRRGMLVDELVELAPDLVALQELRRFPSQGRWIRDRARELGARYRLVQAPKQGLNWWWEGIGLLAGAPLAQTERIRLPGGQRVALRARFILAGLDADLYVTHLHHRDDEAALRVRQVEALLATMAARPAALRILAGDLNAGPGSREIALVRERMRSAYAEVHGREPDRTSPAPVACDWPGAPQVLDYVFVEGPVRVVSAALAWTRTAPDDDHLSASDHYGLVADLDVVSSAPAKS